jgi:hypothetical protein
MPIFARSFGRGVLPSGRHSGACTSLGSTMSKSPKNSDTWSIVRSTSGAVAFWYPAAARAPGTGRVEVCRPMRQRKVTACRKRIPQSGDNPARVLILDDEVQDRDRQHPNGLGEVDQLTQFRVPKDTVGSRRSASTTLVAPLLVSSAFA